MILIINTTSDTSVTEELEKHAGEAGVQLKIMEAGSMNISHCIGCNYCWLKTPGECAVKDDYDQIIKEIIRADQMWVISDTALGFIDHKGKNIFDRILPILTMYLKFKNGQMRHVMRYDKRADLGIIYKGGPDRAFLERWIKRAALNVDSKALGVFPDNEIKEAVSCMCS